MQVTSAYQALCKENRFVLVYQVTAIAAQRGSSLFCGAWHRVDLNIPAIAHLRAVLLQRGPGNCKFVKESLVVPPVDREAGGTATRFDQLSADAGQ